MTGARLRGEPAGTLHTREADTDLPGLSMQLVDSERSLSFLGPFVKFHVEGLGRGGWVHHHGAFILRAHGEADELVPLNHDAGAAGRDALAVHLERDHLPRALQFFKIGFGHNSYIFRSE